MISTTKAISLVNKATRPLAKTTVSLGDSLNHVLASDAVAAIDLPPFNQSAMDGYAVALGSSSEFIVTGEIKAGDDASQVSLQPGEAIKIFTGAMSPLSADLVCRIEDIEEHGETITITKMPNKGANIRLFGEQIKAGEVGLNCGTVMNAAAIGFLANLGIQNVEVIQTPFVQVISTGNELVSPLDTDVLPPGKIYESNGIMLQAALQKIGLTSRPPIHLKDSYAAVCDGIEQALQTSDVLILSGGISVGDYDFVGDALLENGVEQVFYKVNQKPGKPLFFGTKGEKLVFALPGNPAAALTCFYVYVLPALRKMAGLGFQELPRKTAAISGAPTRSNAREQFLKGRYQNGEVTVLEGQSSAMLRSFSEANALIYFPAAAVYQDGDLVEIIELC